MKGFLVVFFLFASFLVFAESTDINTRLDNLQTQVNTLTNTLRTDCRVDTFYWGVSYNRCPNGTFMTEVDIMLNTPNWVTTWVNCSYYKVTCSIIQ